MKSRDRLGWAARAVALSGVCVLAMMACRTITAPRTPLAPTTPPSMLTPDAVTATSPVATSPQVTPTMAPPATTPATVSGVTPSTQAPVLDTGDVYFLGDDIPILITETVNADSLPYTLEWVKIDGESVPGEVYTGVGAISVSADGGRVAFLPTRMLTRKGVYFLSGDGIPRRRVLLVDPLPEISDPQSWPFGLITSADKIDRGAAMAEELYRVGARWFHFDYPIGGQFYFDWPYSVNAVGASPDPDAGRITPGFESFINRAHALGLNPIFKLMSHYADIEQPQNLDGPFYAGLRKIQTYYAGKLKYWVIGNEVEGGGYSQFSPDEYAAVVRNMSLTLKGIDPEVKILAGEFYSVQGNAHLETLLQPAHRADWDILTGHNVVRIQNGNAPASEYKARLAAAGLARPFWDTEANGTIFGGPSEWTGYMYSGFPTSPDADLHSSVNKHIVRAFCLEAQRGDQWLPAFYNPDEACLGADLFIAMHYNANWEEQWSLRAHWTGPREEDHIDEQNHKVADFRAVADMLYGATGLTRIPNTDLADPYAAAPDTTYTGADGYVYRNGAEYFLILWRNTGEEGQDRELALTTDPQDQVALCDSFGNCHPLRNDGGSVKVWVRPEVVYVRGFTRLPHFAREKSGDDAPYFVTAPITAAVAGQPYFYFVQAYDSDAPESSVDSLPQITYSLAAGPPDLLLTDGLLTWSPPAPGDYAVTLRAASEHGASASVDQTFTISVSPAGTDLPPQFASTPMTTFGRLGYVWRYNANAWDPNGNAVTYALAQAPDGMTLDPASGFIQWTPAAEGVYTVTVTASDGRASAAQQITIRVAR